MKRGSWTEYKGVMATDEYGIFATNVREAELDSMEKLGMKTWAQKQALFNYAAKGSAAEPCCRSEHN